MKLKIIIGVIIILVLGGIYFLTRNNTASMHMSQSDTTTKAPVISGKNMVTIQNFAFSPSTVSVKVGEKVTWTNQDSAAHSATAEDNSFDTGVMSTGQSQTITFSKTGTYTYHCSIHPNMTGTVVVK